MKKSNLLLTTLTLGLGAGALASCSFVNKENSTNNNEITKTESFNLEAATSMHMVSNLGNINTLRAANLTEEEANKVKDILPTLDLLLDNGSNFASTIFEEETIIDDVTYKFKEEFTFKNNNLEDEKYTLVYNKEILKEEIEEDEEDQEKEIERSEKLIGFAIFEEETKYSFESISEIEQEEEEEECERYFKINLAEGSYVRVDQEIEKEQNENSTEFSYKLVENNVTTLEYSVEIEKEGNKDSIEYELNDIEYKLERKIDKDNNLIYEVSIENEKDDSEKVAIFKKIVNEDGTVTYELI